MHVSKVLGFLIALSPPSWCASVGPRGPDDLNIRDNYIFLLKPEAEMVQHIADVERLHATSQLKRDNSDVFHGVTHQYNVSGAFTGYAGHFTKDVAEHLESHPDVDVIEPNSFHSLGLGGYSTQSKAPYGLALISNHGKSGDYIYDSSAGAGTTAYIISSGINTAHQEFQGRASNGYNAFKDGKADDTLGVGTHLAAIVGGKTYGVAKKTKLVSVKIFKGQRTNAATLLSGLAWAAQKIMDERQMAKAVILTPPLLAGPTPVFERAYRNLESRGVSVVMGAEAGAVIRRNDVAALVVGATDRRRKRAKFSSDQSGVSLFAPGVDIESAWSGSPKATKSVSGTPQAAAFVAGLVVYFKGFNNWPDAKKTKAGILKRAIPNAVEAPGQALNLFADNAMGLRAG